MLSFYPKDEDGMKEMLRSCPNALIKFQVYRKTGNIAYKDKRLNRTKAKHAIPLGPWAKMVVESILFLNIRCSIFYSLLNIHYKRCAH